MIFYLAWLLPRPYNYAILTILAWVTGTAAVCLWFKEAYEKGEIALISPNKDGDYFRVVHHYNEKHKYSWEEDCTLFQLHSLYAKEHITLILAILPGGILKNVPSFL